MKSISPGTVTIGVLAIVFGLVGVYVARRAFEPAPIVSLKQPPPARIKPGPSVVFANVNLPAKTRITYRDLTIRRLGPNEEPPAGSVAAPAELIGRITRNAIRAGSVMNDEHMYDIGEGPDPTDLIPPGHVAIPIRATANRVGDLLVRMGSRVNITATITNDEVERGFVRTQTLLENVLVIAASPEDFERPSPTLSPRDIARSSARQDVADEITVAVPQAKANELITAQKFGELSVTLCSLDGAQVSGESVVTAGEIFEIRPPVIELVRVEPVPVPVPPPVHFVERWNGTTMETIALPASRIREAQNATVNDQLRRQNETVPVGIRGAQ